MRQKKKLFGGIATYKYFRVELTPDEKYVIKIRKLKKLIIAEYKTIWTTYYIKLGYLMVGYSYKEPEVYEGNDIEYQVTEFCKNNLKSILEEGCDLKNREEIIDI